MSSPSQTVAILGASDKPDRYAFKAFHMLKEYGHTPVPVHPQLKTLDNTRVYPSLDAVPDSIDTLTIYVRPEISTQQKDSILKLKPKRVIFNPGSENPDLQQELTKNGIHVIEACTLVLLRTQQFDNA